MEHVGKKYLRKIFTPDGSLSVETDVYAVLEAFGVTCPATQHCIKKLLCAGLRSKGSKLQDLEEAINACGPRILQLEKNRQIKEGKLSFCDKCNFILDACGSCNYSLCSKNTAPRSK